MMAIAGGRSVWNWRRCGRAAAALGIVALLAVATAPDAKADDAAGGFVDLPNVKLWVTDTGGSGDPVVLLHANTGTAENWEKQSPALVRPAIASSPSTGQAGARA